MAPKPPSDGNTATLEARDEALAASGLTADVILIYPVENQPGDADEDEELGLLEKCFAGLGFSEHLEKKKLKDAKAEEHALEQRKEERATMIEAMIDAGLTCVKHPTKNGKRMLLKVSCPPWY
jgi:hypothetical protein